MKTWRGLDRKTAEIARLPNCFLIAISNSVVSTCRGCARKEPQRQINILSGLGGVPLYRRPVRLARQLSASAESGCGVARQRASSLQLIQPSVQRSA
jgi:hypothetical protein